MNCQTSVKKTCAFWPNVFVAYITTDICIYNAHSLRCLRFSLFHFFREFHAPNDDRLCTYIPLTRTQPAPLCVRVYGTPIMYSELGVASSLIAFSLRVHT